MDRVSTDSHIESAGRQTPSSQPDRASPALPGAATATATVPATVPHPHASGAPVRKYLNEQVTPHLTEGLRMVARDQPKDPLRVVGEYLLQKSHETGESKD